MEIKNVSQKKLSPSPTFCTFAEPYGSIVDRYDSIGQLSLFPGIIAARGRAKSFKTYTNHAGEVFNEAECHYVEGSEADAFAARHDGQFCILVYDAIAYQMLDIFSLAFSCPTFFKDIGDSSIESLDRIRAREKPAGYGFFRKNKSDPIRVRTDLSHPLCPVREQAALYFTGIALDGIWTHELAHAFMGHLDYAQLHLGIRALGETPNRQGDFRQMPLEAEADRFSAATLVQSAFGHTPYLPKALYELNTGIRVRAGFVVSALLTWFWAFQQRIEISFDGEDPYSSGTHPPPLTRLHLSFDGAREMLKNLNWSTSAIQAASFDSMAELEALAQAKNWFSILDPKNSFSNEALAFSKTVKSMLGNEFKTISAELEAYRYHPPS